MKNERLLLRALAAILYELVYDESFKQNREARRAIVEELRTEISHLAE